MADQDISSSYASYEVLKTDHIMKSKLQFILLQWFSKDDFCRLI